MVNTEKNYSGYFNIGIICQRIVSDRGKRSRDDGKE